MAKGLFITFEGCDGSGKTTALNAVASRLAAEGRTFIQTREPGGSAIAEQIRQIILDPANTAEDSRTEALLYAASRRQHLVEVIKPALQASQLVLCDRFIDSSLAYQGYARHIGIDKIWAINQFAIDGCMPDKTLYFDIDPAVGLQRLTGRDKSDRLDQEKLAFHQRVAEGYQKVIADQPDRFIVIDASADAASLADQAYQAVITLVKQHV